MKPFFKQHAQNVRITAIMLIFIWLFSISIYLSATTPPTSDEYTFVPSGYSYWKTGDFRMNTEQPPLIKLINTFPLLFFHINLPTDHPSWKNAHLFGDDGFYKTFVFHANNDKKELLLLIPRIMNVLFSLALGILILFWASELFGAWSGVLALFLYAFEPTVITYSSLFMMDIGWTFFCTLALYTLWEFLKQPTLKRWTLATLTFSAAQLTKYTAVMLFGIYPLIMLTYLLAKKIKTPRAFGTRKILFLLSSYASMVFVSLIIINAIYSFHGSFQTAQQMFDHDSTIDKTLYTPQKMFASNKLLAIIAQKIPLPLPYYYIKGLGYVTVEAGASRAVYLFGKLSDHGFWYYYILSYIVKTPLPTLALLGFAIFYFIRSPKKTEHYFILILPTLAYLFLFSINSKQIGVRHILQIYPLIILFTSSITHHNFFKKNTGQIILALLLLFSIFEITYAFPDYLSYANEIVGLDNGYAYFSDSNVDLGQDMNKAITFIKHNPHVKVSLSNNDILKNYVPFIPLTTCTQGDITMVNVDALNLHPEYQWLRCRQPTQRLGRTLFVYNITAC